MRNWVSMEVVQIGDKNNPPFFTASSSSIVHKCNIPITNTINVQPPSNWMHAQLWASKTLWEMFMLTNVQFLFPRKIHNWIQNTKESTRVHFLRLLDFLIQGLPVFLLKPQSRISGASLHREFISKDCCS